MRKEKVISVTIGGQKLAIRSFSSDIYVAIDTFLQKQVDFIVLDNPKIIVDAGANIGTTAIVFAQKYPSAQIYALEPEPHTFNLLKTNCHQYTNINCIHCALVGTDRSVTLSGNTGHYWGFSVRDNPGKQENTVQGLSLESIISQNNIGQIDLLKVDIEGGELELLNHADNWLRYVKSILIELHENIAPQATRSFYLATKDWTKFEWHAEKIFAKR